MVRKLASAVAILVFVAALTPAQNVKLGTGVKVVAGASSGAMTNITGSVTPTGCTVSSGVCTVGSATSPVSFASIPGIYNKIIIQITARLSDSAVTQDVTATLNGDTGANYSRNYISANTTTVTTVSATGLAGWTLFCRLTAATADANIPGNCEVTLPGYAGTAFYKTGYGTSSVFPTLATTTTYWRISTAGNWASTSAITSISFADAGGGNFNIGSKFIVWGVN